MIELMGPLVSNFPQEILHTELAVAIHGALIYAQTALKRNGSRLQHVDSQAGLSSCMLASYLPTSLHPTFLALTPSSKT